MTKSQIGELLAARFPRPDVPTVVCAIDSPATGDELCLPQTIAGEAELALERVVPSDQPGNADLMVPLAQRPKLAPLSPGRYELRVTLDAETHEALRYAQALLGHALPSGDIAQVLKRALGVLVESLEKQKFAKSSRSGRSAGKSKGRYIPTAIRRAVWERDHGQCTYVSDHGKRCESRTRLEYDHVEAVARGGETTVAGLRLRCQAHNQFEAERTFGAAFMAGKRERAQQSAARAKLARHGAQAEAQSGMGHRNSQEYSPPAEPGRMNAP
jgi:5-methylcytosine-specific restriction endonuclease McrA